MRLPRSLWLASLTAISLEAQMQTSVPIVVRVPATSNPYLAGMPKGTRARLQDRAPEESPVLVPVSLQGADAVTFRASGGMNYHPPPCPPTCDSPNGSASMLTEHTGGAEHGIADVSAPMDSLVGVFLDDQPPDRGRPPKGLDFRASRREFVSLSPQLKQVFFIGTGSTRAGAVRRFLIPLGATRLFLGTMDGYDWYNDTGGFTVAVTLEGTAVSSDISSVDSSVTFADWTCLPGRSHCTPGQSRVEARGPTRYHVLLPANLEWGASIPNPAAAPISIGGITGTVCLNPSSAGADACNGVRGNGGAPGGAGYAAPSVAPGALVVKTVNGQTYFSVNGPSGPAFRLYEGYFEFNVTIH